MAHHQRWVCSAADTQAGQSLANDFHHIIKLGVNRGLQQTFPVRQIARLPYLFSVAPTGLYNKKLPDNQQAPQRQGFPPTHHFIEKAYDNLLDALEAVLVERSYLLGERFTLADASI